ncbi:DUF3047 domain-containing protein [Crenalkalicoccus roseus]|uniref:DUF3047 domain-containing protein n=1 Tax=Crenalkalicoccus roseus TaxID=1485588 RepID=UPI00130531BD|nr:DUF3047 domain-containing protein [Crenalkalicoccus roseus]
MPLATTCTLALLAGAGPAQPPEAAGWRHAEWHGIRPARWRALPGGGVAVEGHGQGSFVWRRKEVPPACLAWRWRVDHGPPATDLTRRGSDRALALSVGFADWPARVSLWQRTRHAAAQAAAGDHPLPRSVLIYTWGGTGREPALFPSPYMSGLGKVRVLRPADAPRGRWFEEVVDLGADWRAAFGGEPPMVQEIAIGTDTDDTRSRVAAAVEDIRLIPCP